MTIIAHVTRTVTRTYGADLVTFNATCEHPSHLPGGIHVGPVDTQNELAACDAADGHNLEHHGRLARYTDQMLEHDRRPENPSVGDRNAAPHLLRLENEELRALAVSRAHLRMNLSGGWNYSGAVYAAVEETLRVGTAETSDEAYAREYRDRLNREREDRLRDAALTFAHQTSRRVD